MTRAFFDTNILLYAEDLDAGEKQATAAALLDNHIRSRTAVLSTQVLQEFYQVATRKLGVPTDVARQRVVVLSRLDLVLVDLEVILSAIDLQRLRSVSFWDALVIRAAQSAKCAVLFSEDMQDGAVFDDVRIINPLNQPKAK